MEILKTLPFFRPSYIRDVWIEGKMWNSISNCEFIRWYFQHHCHQILPFQSRCLLSSFFYSMFDVFIYRKLFKNYVKFAFQNVNIKRKNLSQQEYDKNKNKNRKTFRIYRTRINFFSKAYLHESEARRLILKLLLESQINQPCF